MKIRKCVTDKEGNTYWRCNGCGKWLSVDNYYPDKDNAVSKITSRCKSVMASRPLEQEIPTTRIDTTKNICVEQECLILKS